MENASNKTKLMELEEEMNKLSGQQNLQQRIHHHAKIKVTSFKFNISTKYLIKSIKIWQGSFNFIMS
jgi:kinesin family protein 15